MKDKNYNLILDTDSYKIGGHWNMYTDGPGYINSYFECRNGAENPEQVFFGLQMILPKLEGRAVTVEDVEEAAKYCEFHFGNKEAFNYEGWMDIAVRLQGRLPIIIEAVPEGTVVNKSNVLIQIRNTDPKHKWLVGYLETMLSRIWYPIAVATKSRNVRKIIQNYWDLTSCADQFGINFCLHGFGNRSTTSYDAGGIADLAHLTSFMGTDTVQALKYGKEYYDADLTKLAFSVPATEHSIMTFQGPDGEEAVFKSLLEKYPKGILSVVSDSYDIYKFTSEIAERNKDAILARDGKLVFRPDSGDPVETTLLVLDNLWEVFGGTTNKKGFKVLNEKVGVLWGDGIDIDGIGNILYKMFRSGYSAENIVFGMGSAMVQRVNRDTEACAFKACAKLSDQRIASWIDVFKDPITAGDDSTFTKKSKRGVLSLLKTDDEYQTVRRNSITAEDDVLVPVYTNGTIVKKYTFDEVRENVIK